MRAGAVAEKGPSFAAEMISDSNCRDGGNDRTLDLVITVDTMVAHLAGALGVPVWVMLHAAADWRWLLDRNDSPWYPTMRLFRQTAHDDWGRVVEQVGAGSTARQIEAKNPSPPFRGRGGARRLAREGEAGLQASALHPPPHPALSAPKGRRGRERVRRDYLAAWRSGGGRFLRGGSSSAITASGCGSSKVHGTSTTASPGRHAQQCVAQAMHRLVLHQVIPPMASTNAGMTTASARSGDSRRRSSTNLSSGAADAAIGRGDLHQARPAAAGGFARPLDIMAPAPAAAVRHVPRPSGPSTRVRCTR